MLQVDINDMMIWFTPLKIVIVHSYVKKPGGFYLGPSQLFHPTNAPGRVSKS